MVNEMMKVFSAAFYFLCGWLLVLAVFMTLLGLIYIINVTIEELFGVNLIASIIERIKCRKQTSSSTK